MTYSQPLYPILLLCLIYACVRQARSRGRAFALASAIAVTLCSWPPAAYFVLLPFESRYPMHAPEDRNVQAIVVLSSAWFPPYPPLPTPILGTDTFERCAYAAWLHKRWNPVPILASGGGSRGYQPYALTMRQVLRSEGVPDDKLWTEGQSSSTFENASLSAPILRQHGVKRILLVTEAYHMLRAQKCFEKQGFVVVPAACGFRIPLKFHFSEIVPSWEAISWNEETLHETVGLFWYKLQGRI